MHVADPHLRTRREGGHPYPEKSRGGGGLKKKIFSPFGPQFGPKIRAGLDPQLS